MAPDMQITEEVGIIRAVYRGQAQFDDITEMLRKAAQTASEMQSELLVFAIREANLLHYYASTIRHTEEGPALGIRQTFRSAFLGKKNDQMLRHIEDVTVNRSYRVKVFADESEAVTWLRNAL